MNSRTLVWAETLGMAALLGVVLAWASAGVGLVWDEDIYFRFADSLREWAAGGFSFRQEALTHFWAYDTYSNPHPPFMKVLDALSASLVSSSVAFPLNYRLGHIVFTALALAAAYRLIADKQGRPAGLAALGFILCQPRLFGEFLIGTTDGPVALGWLLLALSAWRLDDPAATRRAPLRALLLGVAAAAVTTKFTGFLALIPLAAFFAWRRDWQELRWTGFCAVFSVVALVALSPQHWREPWAAVAQYFIYPFTRGQIHIATYYLGKLYVTSPPWHYLDLMSLWTFPVLLWLALPGLWFARRDHRRLILALAFPVGFWLLLGHWPATPKHDGVRQFVSLYPLLGLLSWLGFRGVWRRAARSWVVLARAEWAAAAAFLLLCAWPLVRIHPFELSYYNALVGGLPGAEKAGLELTYYFDSLTPEFLKEVNGCLFPHATLRLAHYPDLLTHYQDRGLLRNDVVVLGAQDEAPGAFILVARRRSAIDDKSYLSAAALAEVSHDGVSLVKLIGNLP